MFQMTEDELVYTFALTYTLKRSLALRLLVLMGQLLAFNATIKGKCPYVTFSIVSCCDATGRPFIWYFLVLQVS